MAGMETKATGKTATRWWSGAINMQTAIYIGAAFVSIVIFWKDSKDNWNKTVMLEEVVKEKAAEHDLQDLKDEVKSFHIMWHEKSEKQDIEIEKIADWMHEQDGYHKKEMEGKK